VSDTGALNDKQRYLLQQRTKELQTLVRVAQLINVIDLDYVLGQTLQLTTEVSGAAKGSFFLLDENQRPVQRFITQRNMPPAISRQVALHVIEHGLAGWCVRHRAGTIVHDVKQDERWHVFPDDPQDDVRSALCVPVMQLRQVHGIITLVHPEVGHFSDSDLELVEAIANQASTAIRNAQLFDALQTKQAQLEMVLENNSEALLTVDSELYITLLNPEALTLTKSTEDPLGMRLEDFSPESIYPEIAQRLRQTPDQIHNLSFEIHHPKHEQDWVVNVSALVNHRQQREGYVITIHDITSLKEIDRVKSHMLHMLSHDLKNPLNIIWGYVDLLRIDGDTQLPADPRFIDGIMQALHRMENLIEETLSAERIMAGGIIPEPIWFQPQQILNEAIQALQPLAEQKGHEVVVQIEEELPMLKGTPLYLREAIINLISNAIKYTPDQGRITIKASCQNDRFSFFVQDTGLGIPKSKQNKLFTKFYRANRAETAHIAGTGLGLALVKAAVERHHGQVWFESQDNVGSTFGFWLPIPPAPDELAS
jgi:PAS domain S-box-containing protein